MREVRAATKDEVDKAIAAAHQAFDSWSILSLEERISRLERFRDHLKSSKSALAETISKETGKPLWDAHHEVNAMLNKIPLSVEAQRQRCAMVERPQANGLSVTRHKPHGAVLVMGPFNFPGHLPNGHIVPALLAGNTVVFKPSEYTPLTAALTMQCWEKAELPKGVINLVQGAHETGQALLSNPALAGVFFTGSAQTGSLILKQLGSCPKKILALEMGGNNPLIISRVSDIKTACHLTIQSAYLTSGQRCTCARRLILIESSQSETFLNELVRMMGKIKVGPYTDIPEPFMGPLINQKAAQTILSKQDKLKLLGGIPLVQANLLKAGTSLLSPGLMDVTPIAVRPDEELFGPFLQVIRVKNLQEAIEEANKTQYGLSAGLFSDRRDEYDLFYQKIKAGVINWNTPLTGASSAAPFGGIGLSGNHRPSAFYAADYCSYPVASLESESLKMPAENRL
jgi:succinylglutamic semialdehyde dehydrogenase